MGRFCRFEKIVSDCFLIVSQSYDMKYVKCEIN